MQPDPFLPESLAARAARRPRAYEGLDHETIGSDLLSVLAVVSDPGEVLGRAFASRLAKVTPDGWYPISWMLDLLDQLDQRVGQMGLRQMGRKVFRTTHGDHVRHTCTSARDVIYSLDDLYRRANRGHQIGGWALMDFAPGRAMVECTAPHHCSMKEGLLCEALMAVGVPAVVHQTDCFRRGADSCVYEITSAFVGHEWSGERVA
ncbi:MAG TPA: hypothetical protein VIG99_16075 [Myxococcaceae bacterium]